MVKPVDWAKLKTLLDGFRASGGDVLVCGLSAQYDTPLADLYAQAFGG